MGISHSTIDICKNVTFSPTLNKFTLHYILKLQAQNMKKEKLCLENTQNTRE